MNAFDYIIGSFLILAAIALVALVLMQEGKSKNLSGAIAGGAQTFFGKDKGKKINKTLSRVTTVLAIAFVVTVLTLYLAIPYAFKIPMSFVRNLDNGATTTVTTPAATDPTTTPENTSDNTTGEPEGEPGGEE